MGNEHQLLLNCRQDNDFLSSYQLTELHHMKCVRQILQNNYAMEGCHDLGCAGLFRRSIAT